MKTFFISSTFKDMQAERDILHERVFPRLRTLFKSIGEDVQEVDLRWGVDTVNMSEEESGHEVLRICIDAIDRCKPYLIVLLGERYGWIPDKKIVDSTQDQRINDHYEQEMSITELEIQYGALLNNESFRQCIFCFRSPDAVDKITPEFQRYYQAESSRHAQRLTALKNQIRARDDAVIVEYTADWDNERATLCGLEDFEEQVYQRLYAIFQRDYIGQHEKSLQEYQVSEVKLIRDGYLRNYVRRYPEEFWITKHIADFLSKASCSIFSPKIAIHVVGKAGTGKSALMAYMASSTPQINAHPILCFGAASGCRDLPSLKRFIAYRLESILSEPHNPDLESIDRHLQALDKKAEKKGIVCFVDALDQIYQGVQDPYVDLPILCPNLFWVFSSLPDFPFAQASEGFQYHTVYVDGLLPVQKDALIRTTASKRGKKLDNELVQIISSQPGAENPLFLSLVLQRLFMMNKDEFEAAEAIAPGMEGIHRYMLQLLKEMPCMPDQMTTYILKATAKLFDHDQFSDVIMLIASSHNGLRETDLARLLELEGLRFSPVRFQQMVSYLYDAFNQRSDGRWDFHHRLFREAVLELMTDEDRSRINRLLIDFTLADEEFMRLEGFRYLLAQYHPDFYKVLEAADHWENRMELFDLIGTWARDRETIRDYLETVSKSHLSNAMADFWLSFEEYLYGDAVEAMSDRIIGALLEAHVSDDRKWQLALHHISNTPKDQKLSLLTLSQTSAELLPEPERTIATASIQAESAQVLSRLHRPHAEVRDALDLGLAAVDNAMTLLHAASPWKSYVKILQAGRKLAELATLWHDPDADTIWLKLLKHLESLKQYAKTEEDDYAYFQIQFLVELCDIYCQNTWKDYTKSKQYGDLALELSDIAASQRPTIHNLINQYNANKAYARRLKDCYTHTYWKQNVDCARKIYGLQKVDSNKFLLACAEAEYGLAYLHALKEHVIDFELQGENNSILCLDHSATLFEELIASGYPSDRTIAHATFLAERVILQNGSYNKLIECNKRSMELLSQKLTKSVKEYDEETLPEHKENFQRTINWCNGWIGRTKAAMASISMEQMDYEDALRYARDGFELNRENYKRAPAYVTELLTCALIKAQSNYCLRKDDDALSACLEATALLDELGAKGESREPFDAELYYIRGRIALEHGEAENAWALCQKCLSLNKSTLLNNKTLTLKADCLQALDIEGSDNAWQEALDAWRNILKMHKQDFRSDAMDIPSLFDGQFTVKPKRLKRQEFIQSAYYMAYCYHHYVTDKTRFLKTGDSFEQKILIALYYQGKGFLKGRAPYRMEMRELPLCSSTPVPDCQDFDSFIAAIQSMHNDQTKEIDPPIYPLILNNIEKFLDTSPNTKQTEILQKTVTILYEQLRNERSDLYHEKQECDLLRELFSLDATFPVFRIALGFGNICEIWPNEYLENLTDRWRALLKLLLLLIRNAPDLIQSNSAKLRSAYQVVSEQVNGSREIEKADMRFLSSWELDSLLRSYNRRSELRIILGNVFWYAMRNIWTTELYRRSNDRTHILRRLQEFEEFLTEPYNQLYQQLDIRKRTDMPTEIINAVMHLIRVLNQQCQGAMALDVVKWSESIAKLSGKLDSKTLYSITSSTDTDRRWLEDVKLQYTKNWLLANKHSLSDIRHV